MKIADLTFKAHPLFDLGFGTIAVHMFSNGFGASVITGEKVYSTKEAPYEIAILDKNGKITYDTPLASDVIGYLTEAGADDLLKDIEELEARVQQVEAPPQTSDTMTTTKLTVKWR